MAWYGIFSYSWNQSFWLALLWRWWRKQRFTIHVLTTGHSWHLSFLSSVQTCLVAWYEIYARNREKINKSIYVFFWLRIKYASPIDENSICFHDPSNNGVRVSFFSMASSAERKCDRHVDDAAESILFILTYFFVSSPLLKSTASTTLKSYMPLWWIRK